MTLTDRERTTGPEPESRWWKGRVVAKKRKIIFFLLALFPPMKPPDKDVVAYRATTTKRFTIISSSHLVSLVTFEKLRFYTERSRQ
ncbi:hypothetical protein TSUD_292050 [Trifolium subterraneum]|uniref:Uncharacterized protein n=1 Tax=Trifolium subterraneum TaxID=3900 RepID=A0A2Z6P800_TRISU|nr:hypothetical protein TSUD_292050 [Trifolium subterraneum]